MTHALVEQKYFVSHTPDPELHLPAIEEKARRTGLGFEVEPFRQRPVGKAVERYDIDKAGEIVAVAIARQLGEMKLNVELKLHPSMAEFLGAAGQTDVKVLPDGKLEVLLKAAWAELEVVWRIAGSV